jgi:hypothetical protein
MRQGNWQLATGNWQSQNRDLTAKDAEGAKEEREKESGLQLLFGLAILALRENFSS